LSDHLPDLTEGSYSCIDFNPTYSYDNLRASNCTNCLVAQVCHQPRILPTKYSLLSPGPFELLVPKALLPRPEDQIVQARRKWRSARLLPESWRRRQIERWPRPQGLQPTFRTLTLRLRKMFPGIPSWPAHDHRRPETPFEEVCYWPGHAGGAARTSHPMVLLALYRRPPGIRCAEIHMRLVTVALNVNGKYRR
jgi:hypothetical protein